MTYFHKLCFDDKKEERMEGKNGKKTESCELRRWRKRKLLKVSWKSCEKKRKDGRVMFLFKSFTLCLLRLRSIPLNFLTKTPKVSINRNRETTCFTA